MRRKTVFLFDVDNTLLDNDRVTADLRDHLEREVGHERQERYWSIFEELRAEVGYADYLGALQRYRASYPRDLHVLTVSHFLLEYPFHERLFPNALEVVNGVKQDAVPVILSDGDVVFQPHKIRRSGLYDAFAGAVLIYVHKEFELEDAAQRFPADHYVLVMTNYVSWPRLKMSGMNMSRPYSCDRVITRMTTRQSAATDLPITQSSASQI